MQISTAIEATAAINAVAAWLSKEAHGAPLKSEIESLMADEHETIAADFARGYCEILLKAAKAIPASI